MPGAPTGTGNEPMTKARRGLLLFAWVATVAILGWIVDRHLVIGTDLRLFMPSPRTPQERLILEEIGEGPASRMLLLAISGPDPQAAADTSRALAAALRASGEFRLVANGESRPGSDPGFAAGLSVPAVADAGPLGTGRRIPPGTARGART